jgi:secretion/DNA translocation related TadE-like protein
MLVIGAVGISAVCSVAIARLGSAAVANSRAQTAADAAALAAADQLALARGPDAAEHAAAAVAARNGARLVWCDCAYFSAEVEVEYDPPAAFGLPRAARARAHADVDFSAAQ